MKKDNFAAHVAAQEAAQEHSHTYRILTSQPAGVSDAVKADGKAFRRLANL